MQWVVGRTRLKDPVYDHRQTLIWEFLGLKSGTIPRSVGLDRALLVLELYHSSVNIGFVPV